jgi:multiple sugar transport system substrate-binding protein
VNIRACRPRLAAAAVASAAIVGLALVPAAAGAHSAHRAGPSVVLQFWNAYNTQDAEASTMAKVVIPAFEKLHPNIKVVSDVYPYGQLLSKFLASSSAGDAPDVMRSDIIWVPQLAKEGALLPLSKDMPGFASLASEVYAGPLSTNDWQGVYYGLPLDTNTQVLFWNKNDFAAAHIAGPPKTMQQIFVDAQKLTDPAKKQYGLDLQGTDMWNLDPWIWSMGGEITNATYTKAVGYLNGPKVVQAMSDFMSLLKDGVINPDVLGGTGTIGGETAFPKGISAMYLDGPWAIATYSTLKPPFTAYGMETLPYSVSGGEDVVISSETKHAAAAELFVKFLDSPFSQMAMARAGQMSVLKSLAGQEAKIPGYDYGVFARQLFTARARIPVPQYNQIDTDFSNLMQEAFHNKISVSQALNEAAQQAQALLDQNG